MHYTIPYNAMPLINIQKDSAPVNPKTKKMKIQQVKNGLLPMQKENSLICVL
jgi:hypothetical protein